jgi:sulfide:quinone oxidoreductase
MSDQHKPKIVILGGGLGGTTCAFELRHALGDSAEITLVSDSPRFSFLPSNPWIAVGWRKADEVQIELAPIMAHKHINFMVQGAEVVEPMLNRMRLNGGEYVDYDYLVIATGPDLAFDEIPGLGPEGYTVSICRTDHARSAAEAFEQFCTNPGPIVIGAVQGASCFGPVYEFAMIVDTELRRRKLRNKVPMTLVTPEPYIGHLGLDGVGDTKSMLESELRQRHIKWITNSRIKQVAQGTMEVEEVHPQGDTSLHELPFGYAMLLPAFRGIPALMGIEGLVNPRGFVLIDEYQRNPVYPNIFGLGVCVAIPPVGKTAVAVGVPKTGFMIESMSAAISQNLRDIINARAPSHRATWNAICLADFGDGGVAFVAQPQIPPRNVNWSAEGRWVHYAKIGFEKYFMRKIRRGLVEPAYERLVLQAMGIDRLMPEDRRAEAAQTETPPQ